MSRPKLDPILAVMALSVTIAALLALMCILGPERAQAAADHFAHMLKVTK